jgi:hypothetical protein
MAKSLLGWKSKLTLADMCRDQWGWAQKYPQVGFVCLLLAVCLTLQVCCLVEMNGSRSCYCFIVVELHLGMWGRPCEWWNG